MTIGETAVGEWGNALGKRVSYRCGGKQEWKVKRGDKQGWKDSRAVKSVAAG